MRSATDVAKYIIHSRGSVNTYALQKLLYYAQCWCFAELGHGCFDDKMEAWMNGPVVRSVWEVNSGSAVISSMPGDASRLTPAEQSVINDVLAVYGSRTEDELIEATHAEPGWLRARKGLKAKERGNKAVDPELVAKYLLQVAHGLTRRERMNSALDATRFRAEARRLLESHRATMVKLAMS